MKSSTRPKAVLDALAATRRRGKPYALVFAPSAETAEESRSEKEAEVGNKPNLPCGEPEEPRSQSEAVEATDSAKGDDAGQPTQQQEDGVGGNTVGAREDGCVQPEVTGSGALQVYRTKEEDGDVTLKYEMYGEKFPIKVSRYFFYASPSPLVHAEEEESRLAVHVVMVGTVATTDEESVSKPCFPHDYPRNPCSMLYSAAQTLQGGRITAGEIDDVYCLSFAMPNCTLHLGPLSPSERYKREESGGEAMTYLQGAAPPKALTSARE